MVNGSHEKVFGVDDIVSRFPIIDQHRSRGMGTVLRQYAIGSHEVRLGHEESLPYQALATIERLFRETIQGMDGVASSSGIETDDSDQHLVSTYLTFNLNYRAVVQYSPHAPLIFKPDFRTSYGEASYPTAILIRSKHQEAADAASQILEDIVSNLSHERLLEEALSQHDQYGSFPNLAASPANYISTLGSLLKKMWQPHR